MQHHFIRHIPGMGHQVVHRKHGVVGTYDDRDEALERKDELNSIPGTDELKEHEQRNWG